MAGSHRTRAVSTSPCAVPTTLLAPPSRAREYQRYRLRRRVGLSRTNRPSPGELFSETNDNSVAIILTYGTACDVLDCDAEVGEGYTAIGPCTRP